MRLIVAFSLCTMISSGCRHSGAEQSKPLAQLSSSDKAQASPSGIGPLNVRWNSGLPDCTRNHDAAVQVFSKDVDTFILRQNICLTAEAPFLYLLIGKTKALLLDTGDVADATLAKLEPTVWQLIGDYSRTKAVPMPELVVAHTHGHTDHVAGDKQFEGVAHTTVVPLGQEAVGQFFGFKSWTGPSVVYDLGERILNVLPIPGHMTDHIAVFDRKTSWLLTGDSLYPGRLYTQKGHWLDYKSSMQRLLAFARAKKPGLILGAHIELSTTAGRDYPMNQIAPRPDEHRLEMGLTHLEELVAALNRQSVLTCEVHDDFMMWPLDAQPDCDVALGPSPRAKP